MRNLSLLALTLSTLVACGNSGTEPEPEPETPQIGGTWDYAYAVSNSAAQLSSNGQGNITIGQTGSQFTGQGTGSVLCDGPGGQVADDGAVTLSGGQISGRSVSFRFPLFEASCDADGTMSGEPVNSLQGSMSCSFDSGGQTFTVTGSWSASR